LLNLKIHKHHRMPRKKRAREVAALAEVMPVNDAVACYLKMVRLRDGEIDRTIDNFKRDYAKEKDPEKKSKILFHVFRWIESNTMCLYGSEVSKEKLWFNKREYRDVMTSYSAFEKLGVTLGDPVERLTLFKTALVADVVEFEDQKLKEAKKYTDMVREAVGEKMDVPDDGVSTAQKKELHAELQCGIELLTTEIVKLSDLKRKIIDSQAMLPRLEYLCPVLKEIKISRA